MPEDVSFEFGRLRIRARRIHCSTLASNDFFTTASGSVWSCHPAYGPGLAAGDHSLRPHVAPKVGGVISVSRSGWSAARPRRFPLIRSVAFAGGWLLPGRASLEGACGAWGAWGSLPLGSRLSTCHSARNMKTGANKRAPGKGGITVLFDAGRLWPALPERGRWPARHAAIHHKCYAKSLRKPHLPLRYHSVPQPSCRTESNSGLCLDGCDDGLRNLLIGSEETAAS